MSNVDPIVDKIVVARIGLLLRHPFFGNMATRLRIVDGSNWCNTAATDGRALQIVSIISKTATSVVCKAEDRLRNDLEIWTPNSNIDIIR